MRQKSWQKQPWTNTQLNVNQWLSWRERINKRLIKMVRVTTEVTIILLPISPAQLILATHNTMKELAVVEKELGGKYSSLSSEVQLNWLAGTIVCSVIYRRQFCHVQWGRKATKQGMSRNRLSCTAIGSVILSSLLHLLEEWNKTLPISLRYQSMYT